MKKENFILSLIFTLFICTFFFLALEQEKKEYIATIEEKKEKERKEYEEYISTLIFVSEEEYSKIQEELEKKTVIIEELKSLQEESYTVNNVSNLSKDELIKLVNKMSKDKNITITQGYNKKRLEQIIRKTMIFLDEKHVEDFTALLLLTAQVESDLGYYTSSLSGEDAHGIFQIQSITEKDVLDIFLARNKILQSKVLLMRGENLGSIKELEINLVYSICICYCVYKWRLGGKNPPDKKDKLSQAEVHKKLYNTIYGASTISETLKKAKAI